MYRYHYKTPIGVICIEENDNYITAIYLDKASNYANETETKLIRKAYEEIMEYLQGKRAKFNVPIKLNGTEFQKLVWNELIKIPYGETRTYKEIATSIGKPKAYRAVGGANNKNPIMIIVPCHRVIGKSGTLVGYAGGVDVKEKLLKIET